jgi:hypothetical protein
MADTLRERERRIGGKYLCAWERIRGKTGAANRRWQQRIEERKQPDLQTRAEKKKSGSSGQFKTQTHLNQARTRNRSSNKIWQQSLTGKKHQL